MRHRKIKMAVSGITAMVMAAGFATATAGVAQAETRDGLTSYMTPSGSAIVNGYRKSIWYKDGYSGYDDFNLRSQNYATKYRAFYQRIDSGVWYPASLGPITLNPGTNNPWKVLMTNVNWTTPMVVGTTGIYNVSVKMTH